MKTPFILVLAGACGLLQPLSAAYAPLPPLFKNLGRHHHAVTTKYEMAQRYFDQGLALCFNFNHGEAIRSFEAAAAIDPQCAMAWWGVAYAHGPNINMPMMPPAVPKAWEALQRALKLKAGASPREQAYIAALAMRYQPEATEDRSELDKAYAAAMRSLVQQYPDDLDAQVLLAEALMDIQPWDYWTKELTPKPYGGEALRWVEAVLAKSRKGHPGADHLIIHLTESGPNPQQGVPSAERLASYAPGAGHLVHMPSHTYLRVGRFHDAAEVNEDAIAADEKYLRATKATGPYAGGYYPHNLHLLWYATDIEGRSRDSIRAARKVADYTLDLRCGALEGPRQRYLPLLAWARFGKWNDILKAPKPADEYPFDQAMWHYARGLALAATGRAAEANVELAALDKLTASDAVKALDNPYFPGTGILKVAAAVLRGKVVAALNDPERAIENLRRAVELEGELPYMEPPFWYYSVRESLGAALLNSGRFAEAEQVFRDDLKHLPENGWGLFGLEQSLRAQNKSAEADEVRKRFRAAWRHADVTLDLGWF
jgi:tetratricopeptide (TPR) repeat protein